MKHLFGIICVLSFCLIFIKCQEQKEYEEWTHDDLPLFDLAEEVGQNFYEFLGVEQNATTGEMKKAYRKLSLQWHPDRNDNENATKIFQQLTAINDVLKSDESRAKYDQLLDVGPPDWRQSIYYYRKVRKMSNTELFIIVIVIGGIMQYLMMWGAYFERTLVASQQVNKQTKRIRKQYKNAGEADAAVEEELTRIIGQKPVFRDTFLVTLPRGIFNLVLDLPYFLKEMYDSRTDTVTTEVDGNTTTVTRVERQRPRTPKVVRPKFDMAADVKPVSTTVGDKADTVPNGVTVELKEGGWTVEDLNSLVRLSTQKYPAGCVNRWALVAEAMQRRVNEVTQMAAKLKYTDACDYKKLCVSTNQSSPSDYVTPNQSSKFQSVTHDQPTLKDDSDAWTAAEQSALEAALAKVDKSHPDRWTEIADCVGTRSSKECMARFKHIASMIRQRKTEKA